MNHIMVNLDRVKAVYDGNMESVVNTADMDNGSFVGLGAEDTTNRELRAVVVPTTASILTDEVLIVKSPEIQGAMYIPGTELKDFYNPANKPARAYHLAVGDIFTITTDGVTGTTSVGKFLIPQNASTQLAVAADLTGGTRFAAKIIEAGTFGYTGTGWGKMTSVTAQVVKC